MPHPLPLSGLLRPVGHPMRLGAGQSDVSVIAIDGFEHQLVDSGTSALSLALMLAKKKAGAHQDEVILPAYGCPDLLAACHHAGLKPVLVDINVDFHGFNLLKLQKALGHRTLAVVAVNFLGMSERLSQIRNLLNGLEQRVFLIEDNAQWLPEPLEASSVEGDFVLTSFGRGKPMNLYGGGVLWWRDALDISAEMLASHVSGPEADGAAFKLKAMIFNLLLHPLAYRLLTRLPGLGIGETRYHELTAISGLSSGREALLAANVQSYFERSRALEEEWATALANTAVDPAVAYCKADHGRLLRFPVLVPPEKRDALVEKLNAAGIGASAMYRRPLPEIEGVERTMYRQSVGLECASGYADRLMTLPCHAAVESKHVALAATIIASV